MSEPDYKAMLIELADEAQLILDELEEVGEIDPALDPALLFLGRVALSGYNIED